ncbi:DUF6166 domain-containing protein [Sphaerisporangium sp. NPDC004334]
MSSEDVIYHGYRRNVGGGSFITGEYGLVKHVPRHSPTGMGWGYAGSGAADCARSLLLDALGDRARCCACGGTGQVVFDVATETEQPYDPAKADTYDPELIGGCHECEEGSLVVPAVYQAFKFEFVAGWGDEWRMSRAEILAWFERFVAAREGR